MHKTPWLTVLLIPLLFATFQAAAKQCKGIDFPEQIQMDGARLSLNGLGLREATVLKIDVYVAALYVGQKTNDAGAVLKPGNAKQLVLHFLRDVKRDDITKAWNEGFEKNSKNALPALADRIVTLNGWMADVAPGSRMTFSYQPADGLQVNVGGTSKGRIQGDDFANAFFAIWLGANPPNPELKSGLLGGGCG